MRSSRQDEQVYRRGLIMGLTMAEVMVLILFVLLLLIGLQAKRLLEGGQARNQLIEVATKLGITPEEIPDNFDRLVSAAELAREIAQARGDSPAGANGLREVKELIELGRNAKEQFGRNSVGQSSTQAAKDFVGAAGAAFQQQGGRFGTASMWVSDAATAQAKDEGNGRVLPPCTYDSVGKPAYVFTARLFNESVELEDRDLQAVRALDVWPLFERVRREQRLESTAFLEQTLGIFEWSKRRNCRFYVWIEDATGVAEKRLYKRRLRTVGQHFYYFEPTTSVEGSSAAQ